VLNGEVRLRRSIYERGAIFCEDEWLIDSIKSLPVRVAAEKQVDRDTDNEGVLDCDEKCLRDSNKSLPVHVAAEK
jgi:hypothetical protein